MSSSDEQGRRLRAIRVGLLDMKSREVFAAAVGRAARQMDNPADQSEGPIHGFGAGNVRESEGGRRELRPHEVRAVCSLAGVPVSFFTVDREALGLIGGEVSDDERLGRLEDGLSSLGVRVGELVAALTRRVELGPDPAGEGRPDYFDLRIDEIGDKSPPGQQDEDQDEPPQTGSRP